MNFRWLRHDLLDGFPVDVGEPHVAAAEQVGHPGVIHPQQVQDGGVQVVDGVRLDGGPTAAVVAAATSGSGDDLPDRIIRANFGEPPRDGRRDEIAVTCWLTAPI